MQNCGTEQMMDAPVLSLFLTEENERAPLSNQCWAKVFLFKASLRTVQLRNGLLFLPLFILNSARKKDGDYYCKQQFCSSCYHRRHHRQHHHCHCLSLLTGNWVGLLTVRACKYLMLQKKCSTSFIFQSQRFYIVILRDVILVFKLSINCGLFYRVCYHGSLPSEHETM